MTAPLAGVRVLELATYITGPFAGLLLADLGADVVKIEPLSGDPFRASQQGGDSPRFQAFNRNKRSVALDLRSDDGRKALLRLVDDADVLVENFRPGATERLGVDYAALSRRNPGLVYCSITGMGDSGPLASRPSYDAVGQAMSGLMSMLVPDGDPSPVGPALSDSLTGFVAAYGILAALQARTHTGAGQHVTTSMLQATMGFLVEPAVQYLATGKIPDAHARAHDSQSYGFTCADGRALVIHLSSPQKFWDALLRATGRLDLADRPEFATYSARVTRYDAIRAEFTGAFAQHGRDEWLDLLIENDVPCAPVLNLEEALHAPQAEHLGMLVEYDAAEGAPSRTVGRPVHLDHQPPYLPHPGIGQHTTDILRDLVAPISTDV